jgi:hypothetical protein
MAVLAQEKKGVLGYIYVPSSSYCKFDEKDGVACGNILADTDKEEILVVENKDGSLNIYDGRGTHQKTFSIGFSTNFGFTCGDVDDSWFGDEIVVGKLGDFEGDNDVSIYRYNPTTDRLQLHSVFPGDFDANDGLACGDLDGDNKDEILVVGNSDHFIHIFDEHGVSSMFDPFKCAYRSGYGFTCGNVDGSGGDEIIVAGNDKIYIYDGVAGDEKFPHITCVFDEGNKLACGDVIWDPAGKEEILVARDGVHTIEIFTMDGGPPIRSFYCDFDDEEDFIDTIEEQLRLFCRKKCQECIYEIILEIL